MSTFASNGFFRSRKPLVLLGFYYFRATGYYTDALTDNSEGMHLFGRLLQCIAGECLLVGKFLALNENGAKYVNCFVKTLILIQKHIDIIGFLLFRASGKQTGALSTNFRHSSLCCLAVAMYNSRRPACPGIPFGGRPSYGYKYRR